MRPGEQQPGGGPNPQWSNPYQQPGYPQQPGTPPPGYPAPGQPPQAPQQPGGYPQQPPPAPGQQPGQSPYGTPPPAGHTPQQPYQPPSSSGQWQQPGQMGPPPPAGGGGNRAKAAVAIVVTTAVLAAAVITGVFLLGGDDGEDDKKPNAGGENPSPSAEQSPEGGGEEQSTGGGSDPDDPRQGVLETPDPVVAPDWQVQTIENRHNAFDVPPDWELGAETLMVIIPDEREGSETEGEPLVAMSAVSIYMDDWCEAESGHNRAVAGTKGAQGATGTAEAAENEARNWALAAYDQEQKGKLQVSEPQPFESDHGITGHMATATITDVPEGPDDKCGTVDGKVVAVTYQDLNHDLATWVLVADMGFEGAIDDETIELMMNSLRPYPEEE